MKSIKEIVAIISKLSKQVSELENKAGEFLNAAKAISSEWTGSRFTDKKLNPDFEKWSQLHDDADAAYIKAHELKKVITVWNFNLLFAKKAELLPVWISVMSEYQGKKIGAVREDEIRSKLRALGITGYFNKYEYSCPTINLALLDNNGYCSGCDYIKLSGNYNISFFDSDGKFKMPDLETFKFFGEKIGYIENPKQYIKQLEKAAEKAKKAAAEYDKVLREYNAAAIPGFSQIDSYKESPDSIARNFRINK